MLSSHDARWATAYVQMQALISCCTSRGFSDITQNYQNYNSAQHKIMVRFCVIFVLLMSYQT